MREWRNSRGGRQRDWKDTVAVRAALLDFIAEFANWDNSTNRDYLETARRLVQVAHESLGGAPGTRPLAIDPFAGGGAMPLEAVRVSADAFASDLNPVSVLLNRVVLEHAPTRGPQLADDIRRWGAWVSDRVKSKVSAFYPPDPDGSKPIAYLWARTIRCEGPACGKVVPLVRSFWLTKRASGSVGVRMDVPPELDVPAFAVLEPEAQRGSDAHGARWFCGLSLVRTHDAGGQGARADLTCTGRSGRGDAFRSRHRSALRRTGLPLASRE